MWSLKFTMGAALLATVAISTSVNAQSCTHELTPGLFALDVNEHTVLGYLPESAVGQTVPLVINLHPTGGKGLRTLNESKHVADQNGFIMVAPTGAVGPVFSGWTWNVPGVPTFGGNNYPAEGTRNEVEFISQVIDKAIGVACIDIKRIYAMGFSGGGRMVSQLACDLSDRIASVVAIGGIRFSKTSDKELDLPNAVECSPSRPIPVQAIHGHWDPVNTWYDQPLGETPFKNPNDENKPIVAGPPKSGTSWSYSGETALARWVKHNGCNTPARLTMLADGIEQHDFTNCRDSAEVSVVFYRNLGHAVPGYEKPWAPGQAESPIDGYAIAWELLKDDTLP